MQQEREMMSLMTIVHSVVSPPRKTAVLGPLPLAVLACLLTAPAFARELPASRVERIAPERIRITNPQGSATGSVTGRLSGQIVAFDRVYDFDLEPANVLAPGCMVEDATVNPPKTFPCVSRTYMGPLDRSGGSRIRVSVRDDGYEVLIVTPEDSYIIEPERQYDATAMPGAHVAYRASEFSQNYRAERARKCGADALSPAAEEHHEAELPTAGEAGYIATPVITANVSYGSIRRFPVMFAQAIADE